MAKASGKVQKSKVDPIISQPSGVADKTFDQVKRHYDAAENDTVQRGIREGGFNDIDKLFRTYINPATWPYQAVIADPRTFTFIIEKGSRMIANKLRGRLEPREGGDVLGAKINNSLLEFQWDNDNYGGTQLAKWAMMDQLTRKYGSAFMVSKWRYETRNGQTIFDGPSTTVKMNRDVLPDPSGTCIENCNWVQIRDWPTFQELESVNDSAQTGPVYKNLDKLREAIVKNEAAKGGDRRDTRWQSVNRNLIGLTDTLGDDRVFKTVEIVTEYRRDKWITFAPKYGVVLREIDNPYGNNEIPVVMLRYYAVDDDLYGLSEVEPVMKLFKAINAFMSHAVDEANIKLYSPLKIRANAVRMHTIDFSPQAKWIMNDPMTDVVEHQSSSNNLPQFTQIYSALVAASQEALGESSLGVSNMPGPLQNNQKTATEVNQVTSQTKGRDNFNQIFLAEAIERQMMLWYTMNQKMLINKKGKQGYIVRITGKDAIEFFQQQGLDASGLDQQTAQELGNSPEVNPQQFLTPSHPVSQQDFGQNTKFAMDTSGQGGNLVVEPKDLQGTYDYIADVASMALGAAQNEKNAKQDFVKNVTTNPNIEAGLMREGWKIKYHELLTDAAEDVGFKDADKYFEQDQGQPSQDPNSPQAQAPKGPSESISFKDLPPDGQVQMAQQAGIQLNPQQLAQQQAMQQLGGQNAGINQAGAGAPNPGIPTQGNGIQQGMGGVPQVFGQ